LVEVLNPIAQNNPNSFDQQTSVNAILSVGNMVGTVQVIPSELIMIVVRVWELLVFETAQKKFKLGDQQTEHKPSVFEEPPEGSVGAYDIVGEFIVAGFIVLDEILEIFGFIVIILVPFVAVPVPTAQKIPSISDQVIL